ncbi:Ig-like domain-containing protein, partial [Ligilactobacillus hayakitensis]
GDNYKNASDNDKKALDDAIKHGEDVKNDPKATQQEVDEATKAIENAIKNINDKATTKPTDVTAVKDENGTTVTGKAEPGATITVTYPDGTVVGTGKADDKGNFTIPVNTDKTQLEVVAQGEGKNPSTPVKVTVVDKTDLGKAINDGKDVQGSDNYKNASDDDKKALDDAIKNGEAVKNNPNATQQQVDEATKAIEDAIKNINDKANNGQNDVVNVNNQGNVITGKANPGATVTVTDKDGNVLGTTTADKNGDFAVELNHPQLNGQELTVTVTNEGKNPTSTTVKAPVVDKSALQAAVNNAPSVRGSEMFGYASKDAQKAYNDAIAAGQKVLDNPNATQQEVNDALKAINDALSQLVASALENGYNPNADKDGNENVSSNGAALDANKPGMSTITLTDTHTRTRYETRYGWKFIDGKWVFVEMTMDGTIIRVISSTGVSTLPQTGETDENTSIIGAALVAAGSMFGLGMVSRKRKED